MRPNRASHACGIGPALAIVPVACPSFRYAPPVGAESVSVIVSLPSSTESRTTGTDTASAVTPGGNMSVPLVAA